MGLVLSREAQSIEVMPLTPLQGLPASGVELLLNEGSPSLLLIPQGEIRKGGWGIPGSGYQP